MKSRSRWHHIQNHPLFLKVFRWEYWPMWLAILPTVLVYLYYALRARHLFFFSAVNPTIETGGVFGESKIDILRQIPAEWIPPTLFVPANQPWQQTQAALQAKNIPFPLIAKPNVGERGLLVTKVASEKELKKLLGQYPIDFLLQDFVTLPSEASILYYRQPNETRGTITSVCIKENLTVEGDGISTIEALMLQSGRARIQLPRFRSEHPDLLRTIPQPGQEILLEPIGNHSRGTKFLTGNHLISKEMTTFFDQIHDRMPGIHYGRFDLKCTDPGRIGVDSAIQVLEYNGIAADPAHIYDPEIPIREKYQVIFQHWRIIYDLYRFQRKRGIKPDNWRTVWGHWKRYRNYLRDIRQFTINAS